MTMQDNAAGADKPNVIALPPLIYAAFLATGIALELIWPTAWLPDSVGPWLAAVLVLAGLALIAVAGHAFQRAKTNIRPTLPATTIVTDGPYRFTRNPMYLSMTLIYAGIAALADSLWLLGLLAPLLVVMEIGVIRREERYLARKFGSRYDDYRARVRRWL